MAATRTASLSAPVASRISSLTRVGASWRQISFNSRVMMFSVPFFRPEPGRLPPVPGRLPPHVPLAMVLMISSAPLLQSRLRYPSPGSSSYAAIGRVIGIVAHCNRARNQAHPASGQACRPQLRVTACCRHRPRYPQIPIALAARPSPHLSRVLSLAAFRRWPQCLTHRRNGPTSESLHITGSAASTPTASASPQIPDDPRAPQRTDVVCQEPTIRPCSAVTRVAAAT
jgi:hypothetical protein